MKSVEIVLGEQVRVVGAFGSLERFQTTKVAELLTALAVSHPRPCARTRLIVQLWPKATPSGGRNSLSVALTSLRRAFGLVSDMTVIEGNRSEVWLNPHAVTIAAAKVEDWPTLQTPEPGGFEDLIGREAELARLGKLLRDPKVRLISIVAAGGMGKTALAKACLEGDEFKSMSFVEIQEAPTEQLVCEALARSLGLGAGTYLSEMLKIAAELGSRIYVLDAMEFYRDDAARLIEMMLKGPSTVLITSRRPVGAEDEYLIRLSPLSGQKTRGSSRSAAATLLIRRLEKYGAAEGELLGEEDAEEICRTLEGIPLAIEWAAHLLAYRGLGALRRVIESRNHDELPWRAALTWTYANVGARAQRLWLLLALCGSPLTNDAIDLLSEIENLGGALAELLGFGVVSIELQGPQTLIRILDTMGELARSNAEPGELESAKAVIGAFWAQWCLFAGNQLRGPNPDTAMRQTATMFPAIIESQRSVSPTTWLESFLSLRPFFLTFGVPESVAHIAAIQCETATTVDPITSARLLAAHAYCLRPRDRHESDKLGRLAIVKAIECGCPETLLIAVALAAHPKNRSSWKRLVGETIKAMPGNLWALEAEYEMTHQASAGQPPGTVQHFERILQAIQRKGYLLLEAPCLIELGYARLKRSQFVAAEIALRRAIGLRERLGYGTDADLGLLAMSRAYQGDYDTAIDINRRILSSSANFIMPPLRAHTAARLLGQYLEALRLDEAEEHWDYCIDTIRAAPDEFSEFTIGLLHAFHERIRGQPLAALMRLRLLRVEIMWGKNPRLADSFEDEIRCEMGACSAILSRPDEGRREILSALAHSLSQRKPESVVRALESLALVEQVKGDLLAARKAVAAADLVMTWTGLRRSPAREMFLAPTLTDAVASEMSGDLLTDLLAELLCGLRETGQIRADLEFV